MSELVVDTGAMRAHARRVAECATGLDEAADAAASTTLPDLSFGLLCSFLLPPALVLEGLAAEAVRGAATATQGIVSGLDGSADAYDAVDGAVHEGLRLIGTVLS